MQVNARYFDGRSARCHEVSLQIANGLLILRGDDIKRQAHQGEFTISDPLGNTPRQIQFNDGARCEISDHQGFTALLKAIDYKPSLVARMELHWQPSFIALLIALAALLSAYFWGLPYFAKKAADHIPDSLLSQMDDQFLNSMDKQLLQPSKLSAARQTILTDRLQALRTPPGTLLPKRILFRNSPALGANAFALPGGSVVILDNLVELSENDDDVMSVMAHEMGHVAEHHALRRMLQTSIVGLMMAWYVGDISNMLTIAPTALLETRYSRDLERRADDYAARLLALNKIPASRLATMLEKMERAHNKELFDKQSQLTDLLSSHPSLNDRVQALQGGTRP